MSVQNSPVNQSSVDASAPPKRFAPWLLDKGPVRKLCDEIGFPWDRRLERTDILIAFVRGIVSEIEDQRETQQLLAEHGGKAPSDGSAEVLGLINNMLNAKDREQMVALAVEVHEACWRLNPDEAYPTDHLIDMASSCASAIRFGLQIPCASRHAAAAAGHVWKQVYGISRFDSCTPAWEHDWMRRKLTEALISLLPSPDGAPLRATHGQDDHSVLNTKTDPEPTP